MFDTPKALCDKIRLGEDSFIELKEVRFAGRRMSAPRRETLADELAAFANSRGGVCVLGVEDKTRTVPGIPLERMDGVEDIVREICLDSIEPPIIPVIEKMWLPAGEGQDRAVLKVDIPKSLFVHRSPGGYLHRVGSSKRVMTSDFLARLFQQRSQVRLIRFDEQVVPGSTLDHLDQKLWHRFAGIRSQDSREDLLIKLGMAGLDEDGNERPTVSGILMACRDPHVWMPNAFIQAVAYKGTHIQVGEGMVYQLDAADMTGPLDQQIMDACHFVRKNMRIAATKKIGRNDIPQFDITAVFEAVANAVAHRDYSIYGSKIRLRLFYDRLELYSPGAISNTMTVESLAFRQSSRNETITSLLARCPLPPGDPELSGHRSHIMEKRGEGVPLILSRSQVLSGRNPEYRLIDDAELLLTIYAANPADDEKEAKEAIQ